MQKLKLCGAPETEALREPHFGVMPFKQSPHITNAPNWCTNGAVQHGYAPIWCIGYGAVQHRQHGAVQHRQHGAVQHSHDARARG